MGNLYATIPPEGSFDFNPMDFTLDELSNIILFNMKNKSLEKYSPTGKLVDQLHKELLKDKFSFLQWIETDNKQNLYLKDKIKNAIYIVDKDGKTRGGIATKAKSFTIDKSGNIFYLEKNPNHGFDIHLYARGKKPFLVLHLGYREYFSGKIVAIDQGGRIFLILKKSQNSKSSTLLAVDSAGMIDFEKTLPSVNMMRQVCVTDSGQVYYMIYDKNFEKGAIRILKIK